MPSLLAAIGGIIERHMIEIGFIKPGADAGTSERDNGHRLARYCPKCIQPALVFQEGCHTCRASGYSKCS